MLDAMQPRTIRLSKAQTFPPAWRPEGKIRQRPRGGHAPARRQWLHVLRNRASRLRPKHCRSETRFAGSPIGQQHGVARGVDFAAGMIARKAGMGLTSRRTAAARSGPASARARSERGPRLAFRGGGSAKGAAAGSDDELSQRRHFWKCSSGGRFQRSRAFGPSSVI